MPRIGDLAATNVYNAFDVPLEQSTNVGWANRMGEILTARPQYDEAVQYTTASPLVNISEGDIGRATEAALGGMTVTPKGIRAYHGSPHDVDVLQPGTSGNYGPAVYHHLDAADAERYRPKGGKVYENELNVQKPFEMDKPVSAKDAEAILRAMGNDKLADMTAKSGKGYFSGNELWHFGLGQGGDVAKKAKALQDAGFDAVIGDPGRMMTGKSTRSPEVAVYNSALIDIMKKYGIAGAAPVGMSALAAQDRYER